MIHGPSTNEVFRQVREREAGNDWARREVNLDFGVGKV